MRRRLSLPISYDVAQAPVEGQSHTNASEKEKANEKAVVVNGSNGRKGSSRCEEDFIELEKLGRGGYGSVYAVRNRLDGLLYAMKKIQFKNTSNQLLEKVLREVKTLALLNHPNVVRYHSAWLERDEPHSSMTPPTPTPHTTASRTPIIETDDESDFSHDYDDDDYSSDDEDSNDEDTVDRWHRRNHNDSDSDMEQFNPFKLEDELDWPHPNSASSSSSLPPSQLSLSRFNSQNSLSSSSAAGDRAFLTSSNTWDHVSLNKKLVNFTHSKARAKNKAKCNTRNTQRKKNRDNVNITTLFIVMQLYTTTLAQWLDTRDPNMVDPVQNINIFRQICRGLQYIHSKGVIHRDLKPGNVFINFPPGQEAVVCLGDFGLAIQNSTPATSPIMSPGGSVIGDQSYLSLSASVPSNISPLTISSGDIDSTGVSILSSSVSGKLESYSVSPRARLAYSWEAKKHTAAVGTLTYSSPEQRTKGVYNEKTDIFSLGIIFFELYYPCSTKMEKARVLASLRNGELPKSFRQKYPAEAAFVTWLTSPNPERRPSVDEILCQDLIVGDELVMVGKRDLAGLQETLSKAQSVILHQRDIIKHLEQKIGQSLYTLVPDLSDSLESLQIPAFSPKFSLSSSAPLPSLIPIVSLNGKSPPHPSAPFPQLQ